MTTPAPSGSPAVAYYKRLLKIAPSRKDMTVAQLVTFAQRAAVLSSAERTAILTDLARIQTGRDLQCPKCSACETETNGHHRFYRIRITCCACGHTFNVTDPE